MRALRLPRRPRGDAEPAPAPPQVARAATAPRDDERELAARRNDGLDIVLLWRPSDDAVLVAVADSRTGHEVRFAVDDARAMDAFRHPFAYAP